VNAPKREEGRERRRGLKKIRKEKEERGGSGVGKLQQY